MCFLKWEEPRLGCQVLNSIVFYAGIRTRKTVALEFSFERCGTVQKLKPISNVDASLINWKRDLDAFEQEFCSN